MKKSVIPAIFLSVLFVSFSSGANAYTLVDKIGQTFKENIMFFWTEDQDKSMEKYTIDISLTFDDGSVKEVKKIVFPGKDPQGNPSMFDFLNIEPIGTVLTPGSIRHQCATARNPKCTGFQFEFQSPPNATDWNQTVTWENGQSQVYAGNIEEDDLGLFQFEPLENLPSRFTRIPDLAPASGENPNLTIYTAVNLALYQESNPLGFLSGNWAVGQTLNELSIDIVNGVIPGLEGIFWSTTPFEFDPNSLTGFTPIGGDDNLLDSSIFPTNIVILQEHVTPVPEPTSTLSLLALGTLGAASTLKRKQKQNKETTKTA